MTMKTEAIALVVRFVAQKTNLVRQPTPFESLISNIFGEESYDMRIARDVEAKLDRGREALKQRNRFRKYPKVTVL